MSALLTTELKARYNLSESESIWRDKPPRLIIFATSSVRKAVLFHGLLHDFSFDNVQSTGLVLKGPGMQGIRTPEEVQNYFNEYVYNGDMALTQPAHLGIFEGVPVYALPQQGETANNDNPLEEALHKAFDIAPQFAGHDVYILSSDVVGSSSAWKKDASEIIKLGKPVNLRRELQARATSAEDRWESEDDFKTWYKETIFAVDAMLSHISGTVVLESLTGRLHTAQIELSAQVTEVLHQHLEVLMDSGLGGAWQQLQAHYDSALELLGEAAVAVLPDKIESEQEAQLLYAHLLGVQFLAFLDGILTLQHPAVTERDSHG